MLGESKSSIAALLISREASALALSPIELFTFGTEKALRNLKHVALMLH